MNYLYEEALKLNADGVIFHDLFYSAEDVLMGRASIITMRTTEELKTYTTYPKSGRTYYKFVDGKKVEAK